MRVTFAIISVLASLGMSALADQQTIAERGWAELASGDQSLGGEVLPPNAGAEFEHLKVVNSAQAGQSIHLLTIDQPAITTAQYAIVGQVRCEDVAGKAYLEMLSRFPDGGEYFTRNISSRGLQRALSGSSDWREFRLPFRLGRQTQPPTRITVNVVFRGGGTVYLSPLRLVQYDNAAEMLEPTGAWWSERRAGLVGGLAGAFMGLCGAVIGTLGGMGRGKSIAAALCVLLFVVGLASLVTGVVALALSQPYAVWYPLLLIGSLGAILPPAIWPGMRRRYQQAELRRMQALDA